ncbi:hypothetical protein ACKVMT_14140 [Halobacteriales archaeon Cl-PHB]
MTTVCNETAEQVIERWNTVFKALSAEPRRQLVVALMDAPATESVPLPESATNPETVYDSDVLRQRLRHVDLPHLAEAKFVEWDDDPLTAWRGPRFEEVAVVMEALHDAAAAIPDSLVVGCTRLEMERQTDSFSERL